MIHLMHKGPAAQDPCIVMSRFLSYITITLASNTSKFNKNIPARISGVWTCSRESVQSTTTGAGTLYMVYIWGVVAVEIM